MSRSLRLVLLCATLLTCVVTLAYRSWRHYELRTQLASARMHLADGNVQMAMAVLQPLLNSRRQDGELFVVAAQALRMEGEPAAALRLLDKCTQLGYESAEGDLQRGMALAELGRFADAESILIQSPTKEAAITLAKIHLQLLELERALNDLDNYKKLDPTDAQVWFLSGSVWAQVSEHEKAVTEFRKSLELNPDLYEARLQLALSLIELGQSAEALDRLQECSTANPSDPLPALRLAICQIELGDIEKARVGLTKLISDPDYGTESLIELAKIELQEGNAAQADQLLSEAVRRQPLNEAALYNRALALNRLGRTDDAATFMGGARAIQDARRQLADAMDRINADPLDIDARCDAAELWMELGDKRRAASLFAAVLARDPGNERALQGMKQLN